jgi:hypothetical protein
MTSKLVNNPSLKEKRSLVLTTSQRYGIIHEEKEKRRLLERQR